MKWFYCEECDEEVGTDEESFFESIGIGLPSRRCECGNEMEFLREDESTELPPEKD